MVFKLIGILTFAALFMDPCAPRPRQLDLKDVAEACGHENQRYFVRVNGRLHNTGEVNCGDAPGGRKCDVWIADDKGENQLKAAVKMVVRKDDKTRWGNVIIVPEAPADVSQPFGVRFEEILVYDRVGNLKDHTKEKIDMSGSLVPDSETGICSLRVMYVETDTLSN